MRVTSNLIYNQSALSMAKANERYLKVQEKIAQNTEIVRPSDDPNGAGQLLRYEADSKLMKQYKDNMTLATNSLKYESVALESMNTTLNSINVLMIQSQNGAYSQDDYDTMAEEIENFLHSMADLMNSQDSNGKYIFAGTNAGSPAFIKNVDGRYQYDGDEAQRNAQIGDNITIATNDSGKKIFEDTWTRNNFTAVTSAGSATLSSRVADQDAYDAFLKKNYSAVNPALNNFQLVTESPGAGQFEISDSSGVIATGNYQPGEPFTFNGMEFTLTGAAGSTVDFSFDVPTRDNVLNQVQSAIDALRNPSLSSGQREEAILDAFTSIKNTQANMSTASSSVGARLNTIDNRTDYGASKEIFNKEAQENIGGLNVYKATTELKLSESALEASQLLFQRLSSLSLFNSL
ncbi:flagellar hook-associated protein FlgL [Marinomonas fungiae]|uniref:Flagellar hook-associated protein 3 n=1 Tax=Marinomonas fungiae TaxID=1137284 RepID=A0A0K6IHQ2_9GAMM|nr:flagellar hook-associated protein FlgL [Marinomonas fungiae]CUB02882.1 flagellar hook-associated protein 3 [Marinomonas fungiae]